MTCYLIYLGKYSKRGPWNVIRDENNGLVKVTAFSESFVDIGRRSTLVGFNIVERFAAPFIIGFDYSNHYIVAIRPRNRIVRLYDRPR